MPPMPPDDEEETAGASSRFGGMSPDANTPQEGEAEPGPDDSGDPAEGSAEEQAQDVEQQQPGADDTQGAGEVKVAGRPATPEQEAQYRHFVSMGFHIIYMNGRPNPAIVQQLRAGDPKRCLALAAVTMVVHMVETAKEQGLNFDGAVILHGGKRLFEELADLSDLMKIHKYTEGEVDASWVIAMDMAQKQMMAKKLIDPAAFVRDVQEMNKAEAEGRIDDILPGMGKLVSEVQQGRQQQGGQQQDSSGEQPAEPAEDDGDGPDSESDPADEEQDKSGFKGFGG